ncbi:hypothetical protein MG290_01115 [Flavobacterium sp. CBA20B-1]|uniref:hypothetical protein n=1 Tax=unclassified Flavobacterium TaxID=196869 RepID=UPI002225901F|nr:MULTISPECIES: hypothetical protein [unclassified Flavobacterium]WCM42301.1 hypothetical protein MG290_01115 [Flavobacterium sp. CBA20B-1]
MLTFGREQEILLDTLLHKGVFYPNRFIIHYCIEYIEKNYPDFELVFPDVVGKELNAYLKSKGANTVIVREENSCCQFLFSRSLIISGSVKYL